MQTQPYNVVKTGGKAGDDPLLVPEDATDVTNRNIQSV